MFQRWAYLLDLELVWTCTRRYTSLVDHLKQVSSNRFSYNDQTIRTCSNSRIQNINFVKILTLKLDFYYDQTRQKYVEVYQMWTPKATKLSTLWISKISTFVIVVVKNIILVEFLSHVRVLFISEIIITQDLIRVILVFWLAD